MLHLYLLLPAFFILTFASAQSKVDSLKTRLEYYHQRDTSRVDLINSIGYEYWVLDAFSAEKYGTEALTLAEELQYGRGIAMAHRVIGVSHWCRGNFYPALTHLFESQRRYKSINDPLGVANATLNMGMVYEDQRYYDEALKYYSEALEGFEVLRREDRQATTYTKIGTVYI